MKKTTLPAPSHSLQALDQKALHSFQDLLKDLLGMEKHQLILFPMLKRAASCLELQNTMARSLDDAREHISRLEQVFILLGQKPKSNPPEAILGIGREAEEVVAVTEKGSRDAGLILIAQQIEHYEISVYGNCAQMARNLELDEILDLLEANLFEEKETDDLLTALAEYYINVPAGQE